MHAPLLYFDFFIVFLFNHLFYLCNHVAMCQLFFKRIYGYGYGCSSSDSAPVQCGPANHKTATWSNGLERENLLRQAPSAGSNGLETLVGDVE